MSDKFIAGRPAKHAGEDQAPGEAKIIDSQKWREQVRKRGNHSGGYVQANRVLEEGPIPAKEKRPATALEVARPLDTVKWVAEGYLDWILSAPNSSSANARVGVVRATLQRESPEWYAKLAHLTNAQLIESLGAILDEYARTSVQQVYRENQWDIPQAISATPGLAVIKPRREYNAEEWKIRMTSEVDHGDTGNADDQDSPSPGEPADEPAPAS